MSQENVEVVRQYFDPFDGADFLSPVMHAIEVRQTRGDESGVASMGPAWTVIDPRIELDTSPIAGEGPATHFHGYSGFLDFWADWLPTWEEYVAEVSDYIDCGETIIADVQIHARAVGTESPITWRLAQACDVRDRKIVRMRVFPSTAEALDLLKVEGSVGHPEQDAHADS